MRFIKGMLIGGLVTAGISMMYKDEMNMAKSKKKMVRKGKQMAKRMGIL